jgi:hypothetical protein
MALGRPWPRTLQRMWRHLRRHGPLGNPPFVCRSALVHQLLRDVALLKSALETELASVTVPVRLGGTWRTLKQMNGHTNIDTVQSKRT